MKITKKSKLTKKRFGDISVGTVFKFDAEDRLYIKSAEFRHDYITINAMELSEYYLTMFSAESMVEVVDAELIVD